MAKKGDAILLLDRDSMTYADSAGKTGVVFRYSPDVIHDLEVINKEQLVTKVSAFINNNKFIPSNIILLLSDAVLFTKDIFPSAQAVPTASGQLQSPGKETTSQPVRDEDAASKREEQIKHFLDSVPFENTASKVYTLEKGVRVAAANRDFYETIESVFEEKGSTIFAVVPTFLVWKEDQAVEVSNVAVSQIFGKSDFLKQQSFPLHYAEITPEAIQEKKFSLDLNSKSKPRATALIGIFVVLLGVFGFMLTSYLRSSDTTTQSNASGRRPTLPPSLRALTVVPTAATSTPLPSGSPSAQPTTIVAQNVKIQISFSSASLSQESVVTRDLTGQGFTNVSANSQTTGSANPLIVFRASIPSSVRDFIFQSVKKQFPSVSQQQTTDLQFDAVINLP